MSTPSLASLNVFQPMYTIYTVWTSRQLSSNLPKFVYKISEFGIGQCKPWELHDTVSVALTVFKILNRSQSSNFVNKLWDVISYQVALVIFLSRKFEIFLKNSQQTILPFPKLHSDSAFQVGIFVRAETLSAESVAWLPLPLLKNCVKLHNYGEKFMEMHSLY